MVVWQEEEFAVNKQWCRQDEVVINDKICQMHYSWLKNFPYHRNKHLCKAGVITTRHASIEAVP